MRRVIMWIGLFVLWLLLAWPAAPDGGPGMDGQVVTAGLLVALLAAWIMGRTAEGTLRPWINPMRYVWFVAYLLVLACAIVKANFDVAYRVLHPAMPLRPGIVKIRTSLTSAAALAALANSITLTPGTLTVNAAEDGVLYVHWIWVHSTDVEEASRRIAGRFEWFIKRIWE